jgi:hypothetical protein
VNSRIGQDRLFSADSARSPIRDFANRRSLAGRNDSRARSQASASAGWPAAAEALLAVAGLQDVRREAQFTAMRYFALDGTHHASHEEQAGNVA